MKKKKIVKRLFAGLLVLSLFSMALSNPVYSAKRKKSDQERYLDFSTKLFKQSLDQKKNTLISPLSVFLAMGMTTNGAKGKTLKELEKALGMKLSKINSFVKKKVKLGKELKTANSIWIKKDPDLKVNKNFIKKNQKNFDSAIKEASFNEETLKAINAWVEKKTEGRIKDILNEIPEDAMMYLINALSFDAEWKDIYKKNDIIDAEFTNYEGEKKNIKMMYSTESGEGSYLEDKKVTGFVKPYKDSDYAFVGLLPKEGVDILSYVKGLKGSELQALLKNKKSVKVEAGLPKFKAEFDTELSEAFQKMGAKLAFGRNADFSGMGTVKNSKLFINRIIHKTFLEVDGKGTKAGAATVVEMMKTSAVIEPENTKKVILDRPFVYMLLDKKNNLPIFIGTMLDVQ